MADAYPAHAAENRVRWDALFSHRLPATPRWLEDALDAAFAHIEAPLGTLRPALGETAERLLARSMFAAVHGMAALGLDKRLAPVDLPVLRAQIRLIVTAIINGLPTNDHDSTPHNRKRTDAPTGPIAKYPFSGGSPRSIIRRNPWTDFPAPACISLNRW